MKRFLAWAGIFAIAAAFFLLVYFTATGASSNAIMAMMFILIVLPVFIYAFLLLLKLKDRHQKDQPSEQNRDKQS